MGLLNRRAARNPAFLFDVVWHTNNNIDTMFTDDKRNIGKQLILCDDKTYINDTKNYDTADVFHKCLQNAFKRTYSNVFQNLIAFKVEEFVLTPHRLIGDNGKCFFQNCILQIFKKVYDTTEVDTPVIVYFPFFNYYTSIDTIDCVIEESMLTLLLSTLIEAGYSIDATWPIHIDIEDSQHKPFNTAFFALVCCKRHFDARIYSIKEFILLKLSKDLREAIQHLLQYNLSHIELKYAAIGIGLGTYSRCSKVLFYDGCPIDVCKILSIIQCHLLDAMAIQLVSMSEPSPNILP